MGVHGYGWGDEGENPEVRTTEMLFVMEIGNFAPSKTIKINF